VKKIVFLLAVIAVMVLLFAPVATAKKAWKGGSTATATATTMASGAAASGKAGKLPKTGGPAPFSPIALLAGVVLVSSGLAALTYVRREGS
jgi:hypothetical protein